MTGLSRENLEKASERFIETFGTCQEKYGSQETVLALKCLVGSYFVAHTRLDVCDDTIVDSFDEFAASTRSTIVEMLQEEHEEQTASRSKKPVLTVVK